MFRALIIALLVAGTSGSASAQRLFIKSYTLTDGLPASQIFTGLQDSKGYLWFGSPSGTARYDGAEFRIFSIEDGLLHDSVRSIVEWRDAIWLAGEKGLSRFDGENYQTYTSADGLAPGIVWRVAVHHDALWLGTNRGGLSRFDGERFITYTTADGLPSNNVFALFSRGDDLWIGTRGGGLARWDTKRFHTYGAKEGFVGKQVMAIAEAGDTLWFGTRDAGIIPYRDGRFGPAIAAGSIYSVAVRGKEIFWGTLGSGVLRMAADGTSSTLDQHNGLASDRVYSIVVDREDNIWFTTSAGVSKLISDAFRSYLVGTNVLALADHEGTIWAGTLGAGLVRLREHTPETLGVEDGLWSDTVWSLEVHDGQLFVGCAFGLNVWDGRRLRRSIPLEAPPYDLVSAHGDLWIATAAGVCRFDGERCAETYRTGEGLPSDTVYAGTPYGDGVCFATEEGVGCIEGGAIRTYAESAGLPSSTAYSIATDPSGTLWVGTNRGLSKLDDGRFHSYGREHGLLNRFVASLTPVEDAILVGTSFGVHHFRDGRVERHFDSTNGLAGNELNFGSVHASADGTTWFGFTTGLTQYLPRLDVMPAVAPQVWIQNATSSGVRVRAGERLPPDRHDLVFNFTATSFKDEADVVFRYRLDGYDVEWSQPDASRVVRYTNLPAGAYTFEVEAKSGAGVWSDHPARFAFGLSAPYWKTWWFIGIVILCTLGLLYGLFRLRVMRIQHRSQELEAMVGHRTQQLSQANVQLKELALTDPLTQLRNRRFFMEMIDTEAARIQRSRRQDERRRALQEGAGVGIGFIVIDIDHFKQVNDTHGHEVGDLVLTAIAGAITASVREPDWVVRWGGEEFLVVAQDVDAEQIRSLAERIHVQLGDTRFELPNGGSLHRTCSAGFSLFPFGWTWAPRPDYEDALRFADRALYIAKENGRNRVVGLIAGEAEPSPSEREALHSDLAAAVDRRHVRVVADGDVML